MNLHPAIREVVKTFTRDPKWRKFCKAIIVEVGCCECCETKKHLQGHHILPVRLFPDLELVRTNIIVLCWWCHFRFGHLGWWRSYNPGIRSLANKMRETIEQYRYKNGKQVSI